MANVVCPKCKTESYFSLATYKGPFRCMKCKETFNIVIDKHEVTSCELTSQAEVNRLNVRKHYD